MKKHGFVETKASIANKLARGTHPTAWFLERDDFRLNRFGIPKSSRF